jgi:hypothetical protein
LGTPYDPEGPPGAIWYQGDPVVCRPGGWNWGTREDPDTSTGFYIVTITDKTVEEIGPIITSYTTSGTGDDETRTNQRNHNVEVINLEAADLATLEATGRLSLTFKDARKVVRNKTTGLTI